MKTVTIITPANIEVEYRLAGAGSRLAAFTVDFLLQTLACLLVAAVILLGFNGLNWPGWNGIGGYAAAFIIMLLFTVYSGYFIICELTMNGQSVGKKIFGLRVIRDNGQPVTLTQSLIRNVFRIALDMLYVGLFVILFSKNHKRIGDMAAGTVVVSEHYYAPQNMPMLMASYTIKNTFSLHYPHITLTEEERHIIKSWLSRRESLPDSGTTVRKKITAYFSRKWNVEERLFTDEVLERILQS